MKRFVYRVVHSIPGRMRVELIGEQGEFGASCEWLRAQPSISAVTWNAITKTAVIEYKQHVWKESEIRFVLDTLLNKAAHGFSNTTSKANLWFSLLAGGALIAGNALRRKSQTSSTELGGRFELLAAALTAYSVLTHRNTCEGNARTLHPDSLAGLLSLCNVGSDRALPGLVITWILNFLEILAAQLGKPCSVPGSRNRYIGRR